MRSVLSAAAIIAALAAPGLPIARAAAGAFASQPAIAPSPRERLESLAAEQRERPDDAAMRAPAPPGAEAALSTGPTPEDLARPGAREPLEAVLERFAAMVLDEPAGEPPARPSDADGFAATRLYVQARQKLLDGDVAGAIADLDHAVLLDPGAPWLWLALGEARLRGGREQAGIDAMRRAVALGLEHPRPLMLLCTWEATHGQAEAAIHHGARATRAAGMREDAALPHMVWASLADALLASGYLHAASVAYVRGFDLPDQFPAGTAYTGELSSMYRNAWEALFRAGSIAAAVEDWETAKGAFEGTGRFQGLDGARALPPRILADLRLGRPAEAALAILHAIEVRGVAADERTLRLIRFLRDETSVGPMLAAALTELDARVRGRSPAVEVAMARAVAAGLPDGLGRGPLVEALSRHASHVELAHDLLASFGPEEEARALEGAARLADEHPVFAQTIADGMLQAGLRTERVLQTLRTRIDRPGAGLLLARLLIEAGRFDEAREVLSGMGGDRDEPAPEGADERAAARRLLTVLVEALSGNPEEARRLIDPWPIPRSAGERLLLVRALQAVGDLAGAADAAGDPEPVDEASRVLLGQACQIARARGETELAARLARRLIEADPYAEQGYGVLIGLLSPSGPLANQQRLAEVLRGVRENVPSSPLIRYLSARELAQLGALADADARLRTLAEDVPNDDNVLRSLIEVWSQRVVRGDPDALDRGEEFLAELAARHGTTLAPAAALAVLRATRQEPERGVEAIGEWLDGGLLPTAEDRNRLRGVIEPLLRRATSTPDQAYRRALLALWERMDQAEIALDPPMHQARLVLLSQSPPFDAEALLAAARSAADQVALMDPGAYLAPVGRVVQGGRPDIGLALLRAAAARPVGLAPEDTARWAGLIAQHGRAEDLRDLFALTSSTATLSSILLALPASPEDPPEDVERLRADIAYAVSATTRVMDRQTEVGESFLLLALELAPEHESAANDLGYQWADRGVRLQEAERLLEMAHRLQPDEPNVLDSLGWLRYKQGRLSDVVDEGGAIVPGGEGAATLLERAAAGLTQGAGPVTLDQLGDTLWRLGRHEEALARWREALPRAESTVETYQSGNAPPTMLADARSRLESLQRKIAAAEAGVDPPIAPLGEGVTTAR